MKGCINDNGKCTDPYLPRKCQYSNRIIDSKDRSSVQIALANIKGGKVDLNDTKQVVISGFVRSKGESDFALEKILREQGDYPVLF